MLICIATNYCSERIKLLSLIIPQMEQQGYFQARLFYRFAADVRIIKALSYSPSYLRRLGKGNDTSSSSTFRFFILFFCFIVLPLSLISPPTLLHLLLPLFIRNSYPLLPLVRPPPLPALASSPPTPYPISPFFLFGMFQSFLLILVSTNSPLPHFPTQASASPPSFLFEISQSPFPSSCL